MAMFRKAGEVESRKPMGIRQNTKEKSNHESESLAYCDICLECWDSDTEVEIHRNTAHREELKSLLQDTERSVCRVCVKSYEDRGELLAHIKSYHLLSSPTASRVEREIFICDCCTAVFFNKQLLQAHILIFHANVNRLKTFTECPKCQRSYRLKTMWYHFQAHDIQSVSCCKICLTKCRDRKDLSRHIGEHVKHLFCDTCQYQSKSEAFFKDHLINRHNRPIATSEMRKLRWKPYFLPRSADYKPRLQADTPIKGVILEAFFETHLRLCVLCREICVGETDARAHLQSAHVMPDKPRAAHQCNCGETFNNKVLLKHHIFKNKGTHAEVQDDTEIVYAIVVLPTDSETETGTPSTT